MAKDWLITRKPAPRSYYKPAPKPVKKKPPIIKPGERRPNQYTDTGGENVPAFYNPAPAPAPAPRAAAKKVLGQPVLNTTSPELPDIKGRPSYFQGYAQSNPIRWAEQYTDPGQAMRWLDQRYLGFKKQTDSGFDDYERAVEQSHQLPTTYAGWIGKTSAPFASAFAEVLGLPISGKKQPTIDPNQLFGKRYMVDRSAELNNEFYKTDPHQFEELYADHARNQAEAKEAAIIDAALTRAAPVFAPLLDENGNVLAPALMTPKEYADGLKNQEIFDPLLPDSKFSYGKTKLVFQDGKIKPAEEWYRDMGDHLIGGNWELPEFTDQGGYQYNSRTHWDNPSMAIGIENKALQNAMNDARITGNQFINPNFYPHINYQMYDQVVGSHEYVEDGYGDGGGGGYGDGYGYGYGDGYGGGSYGPGYYTDGYRQDKGQYYSQLARWVI